LKTCQKLGRHFLLLELDRDIYLELLQPLLDVIQEQTNVVEEENNDLDVPVQKKFRLNFDCE
jgi:hypothetical protein